MSLIRITPILKNGIQSPLNNDYDLVKELRSHIQTFQSEVHFLSEELKEKSVLLRLLINTNNNQRNIISDKTPENSNPTFPSKENNSETKKYASLLKDDVIDFCIDDTTIKSDATGKNKVISSI